jgi:twitching motility protein PilT
MNLSEKARVLREAPWSSPDEMRAFVSAAHPTPPSEIEKLLGVLLEPGLAAQGPRHVNRCSAFRALAFASIDARMFAPLAKALPSADPVARRAIAAILPRANDVESHRLLCEALGSPDADARAHAAAVLEQVGGPSALVALEKLVRQREFAGREEAMNVMLRKARHRALPLIAAILECGTRREQVLALSHLTDPVLTGGRTEDTLPHLRRALAQPDAGVLAETLRVLATVLPEDAVLDELAERVAAPECEPALIDLLGTLRTPRAASILASRLRTGSPPQRLAAIRGLRAMAIPEAVEPLVEAAYGTDASLRRAAMDAIGALAEERKVDFAPVLLALLRNPDAEARRTAAQLAARMPSAGAIAPQLLQLLRDEDWYVRERVLEALVEMKTPDLAVSVVQLLDDASPVVRRYAIYALLRFRDPETLGAMLATAVRDEDWWVREQAVLAIGSLGDARAIPYLRALLAEREDMRVVALEALGALEAHEVILDAAEILLGDPDPSVRSAVLEQLETTPGAEKVAFYVQACVGDPIPAIARAARDLLARHRVEPDNEAAAAVGMLDRLLVAASRREADDVMLQAGRPPHAKRHGAVFPLARSELTASELAAMLLPALAPKQREHFDAGHDVDFSYEVKAFELRFRVNLFRQATGIAAVLRRITAKVPELDTLGLPPVVKSFADFPHGLVLVGGPTGSGKSTTLAALVDAINRNEARHIVTIEDPIEVIHESRAAIVNQREVGTHAPSFADALRSILRQDPDVVLVGELRDVLTMEFALQAAETGHLVFATVHTVSAAASIDRLVHAFPGKQQGVVRSMIADSLRAVCCQQLLRRIDHENQAGRSSRALACEVLIATDAVSNLVRKDKCFQLPSVMATSREQGMTLMDEELARLVAQRIVAPEEALAKANDTAAFATMLATSGFLAQEEARTVRTGAAAPRTVTEAGAARARPEPAAAPSIAPKRSP